MKKKEDEDKLITSFASMSLSKFCPSSLFDEDAKTNGCFGPPQIVNLPYACNTNIPIKHKLQAFESKWVIDDSEDSRVGNMQYHMVLSIELESKEKPVCRVNKKGMRVFKSP